MTAVATPSTALTEPPVAPVRRSGPRRGRIGRWIVLAVAAVYFIGPLVAAFSFTVRDPNGGVTGQAYGAIFSTPPTGQIGFSTAVVYSLVLAAITIVLTLVLMVPTQLLLHLRLPRWRPLVEVVSLLPLVFPPVVFVVGLDDVFASVGNHPGSGLYSAISWSRDAGHPLLLSLVYVVLALPFVYRSLDSGIRSIDAHTLTEAARGLGAGWLTVLVRILLPGLRTAVVNAAFLTFALVMGEYTIASILLYTKPFPVWLAQLPTTNGAEQAAVSVLSLLLVEAILLGVGALNWRHAAARKG